jgi:Fe-S cluster assembly iron-binding protein IscA
MTNTSRSVENEKIVVKMRIYTGGLSSYPTFSFNSALQSVVSCWSTKFFFDNKSISVLDEREMDWSEKDFVDWWRYSYDYFPSPPRNRNFSMEFR